jgi:GNAT superfamily N-acetyltransferase
MLVSKDRLVGAKVTIRPFAEHDAAQVRELFILSTDCSAHPTSVTRLRRISSVPWWRKWIASRPYYGEKDGGLWVAAKGDKVVGIFGLERASKEAMELRRMYVDPSVRQKGIARQMLHWRKTSAAVETYHGLSLALLNYSTPL